MFFSDTVSGRTEADTLGCAEGCFCGTNPTPAGVMISHVHLKGEWMLSYRYMSMEMKDAQSGRTGIGRDEIFSRYLMAPEKMRMDMHMLMMMYGMTDRLTGMAMLNYNVNSMEMAMFPAIAHVHGGMDDTPSGHSNGHTMKSSGIGDLKLYLLYGLMKRADRQLVLSAGVSLPSGNILTKGNGDDMMYPDGRYPYSMQLGSGSVDLMPGITYLVQSGKTTFSTQLSSLIRTGYNSVGYKLGNEMGLNLWFAYQWMRFLSSSMRLEGNWSGNIDGVDPSLYAFSEISSNPYNYGGRRAGLYLGSAIQPDGGILRNHKVGIEYGIPVYQNLNGVQMKSTHSLFASWTLTF